MALTTAQIQNAYVAFFNRPANVAGLTYWSTYAGSTADLLNTFAQSTEYKNLYSGLNNTQIVNAVYSNLFGHTPDVAGLTYWVTQLDQGKLAIGNIADAINKGAQGTDATIIANKTTAATEFTKALDTTAEIVAYAGVNSTGLDAVKAWLAAVTSDSATLTNATSTATLTSITTTVLNNVASTGSTFTLTTGLDNVAGTSGNDTIIGEFATSPANSLNAGDQVNGGAGTDTLKLYGTYTAAQMPITVKGVEVLDLAVAANAALDLSGYTKAASGVEKVIIGNAAAINGQPVTTTDGQSLSLATGAGNVATVGTVTWAASTTDTSVSLTLNGYQGDKTVSAPKDLTITAANATTQNIVSSGAANQVGTLTLGAKTEKVVITGDQSLNVKTNLVSSGGATVLKTVDASASTGGVKIALAATPNSAFAFTGGSGSDSIKFANDGLAALVSGAQLDGGAGTNDKLGITDAELSTTEFAAINAAKNFEVLGLNAAITLDASKLTAIKNFSLDDTGTKTVSNMATGSQVTLTKSDTNVLSFSGATGVNDLKLAVGSSTSTGLTMANLTVGQTTVALESNGTAGSTNTITDLKNADNSTYTVTGSTDLTITNPLLGTNTGSKIDATAFTGKLSVVGSGKSDVLIGGSANDTINGGAITTGVAAVTESAVVKFADAVKDKTVTFAGLALTVTDGGGMTAAEIASAFASLTAGATAGNTTTKGTWSGTLAAWSTGAAATDTVTFTSTTANTDVTNLAQGTAGTEQAVASITKTQGNNGTAQSVDTLTGNGGNDVFVFSNIDLDTAAAAGAVTAVITDFKTGVDSIKDTTVNALGSATNYVEATTVAASMSALYTAADTALDAAAVKYYVGQVGSDTYVFTDNDATGFTNVIKLTGVALDGIAYTDFVA